VPDSESLDSNRLWAAMDPADQEALKPHMTLRHLPRGDILTGVGESVGIVYFPVTADLANVIPFSDGHRGMATNVGREGVSGLAAFLADEPCGWDVQVQIGGAAWALPAEALRKQVEASASLLALLLSLTHFNQIEAAQNAVCHALHTVTPQVARWLLTVQDRIGLDRFPVTQEDVGALIAARRTTVNASWQELRSAGAIAYSRGNVRIVDRAKLKSLACECYAAIAVRADGVHR
jgi:CRP-like cAMP-binding protein